MNAKLGSDTKRNLKKLLVQLQQDERCVNFRNKLVQNSNAEKQEKKEEEVHFFNGKLSKEEPRFVQKQREDSENLKALLSEINLTQRSKIVLSAEEQDKLRKLREL